LTVEVFFISSEFFTAGDRDDETLTSFVDEVEAGLDFARDFRICR
jgi:hypothetical protein